MKTTFPKTTTPTRFSLSRAQLSPVTRRAPSLPPAQNFVTVRITEVPAVPNFWSSGELDRLQPEVTRYHD